MDLCQFLKSSTFVSTILCDQATVSAMHNVHNVIQKERAGGHSFRMGQLGLESSNWSVYMKHFYPNQPFILNIFVCVNIAGDVEADDIFTAFF